MTQKLDGGQFIFVAPLCSSVCLLVMLLVFVVACVSVSLRFVTGEGLGAGGRPASLQEWCQVFGPTLCSGEPRSSI